MELWLFFHLSGYTLDESVLRLRLHKCSTGNCPGLREHPVLTGWGLVCPAGKNLLSSHKDKQHERCPEESNEEFLWQPTDKLYPLSKLSGNLGAMSCAELDSASCTSHFDPSGGALCSLCMTYCTHDFKSWPHHTSNYLLCRKH